MRFATVIKGMTKELKKLGPTPLRPGVRLVSKTEKKPERETEERTVLRARN